MIKYSTIQHLRFPFSFFLLPVYLFALSQSFNINDENATWIFFILHGLIYPASNGYNSYFDKDKKSIGGLKSPPEVTRELYVIPLVMEAAGILLALWIHWQFAVGIFLYGLASKAYSHPLIRLKKYAVLGWVTIGIFQGFLVYLISFMAINNFTLVEATGQAAVPAMLAALLLLGSYPMTQVYQHEEDFERGDLTISYKLGIRGTFHFTAVFFAVASTGFVMYFIRNQSLWVALAFLIAMIPAIVYFGYWYFQVRSNVEKANYENTMKLNIISSTALSLFFGVLFFSERFAMGF